jgi:hypothetical protein
MIARIPIALAFMLAIAAALFGTSDAKASDIVCSGTIGGGSSAANLRGQVVVPDNAFCTLNFVNVSQGVTVGKGGSLTIVGYLEPSTIGGPIVANNCGSVLIQGNVTVEGDVAITSCKGSRTNGFQGPDTVIKGNFTCEGNKGACLAWLGKVEGKVEVRGNHTSLASDISLVDIGGQLACAGNAPAPTHLRGPSWGDTDSGQCNGFLTKTTSIAVPVTPAANCAALATIAAGQFPVPNTVIISAVDTPAGSGQPQRCIVNGYVNQHTSLVDNCVYKNQFQVQLPLPGAWNGKFVAVGGGGSEGSVPTATGSGSGTVANGYAVATQDGGHENNDLHAPTCDSGFGNNNQFYLDPVGTITNATQSIQTTAITAKFLINQFYGDGPQRSYWTGCSTGGRQAMSMMQNYPQFFDGIIAGDPVYNLQGIGLTETWGGEQMLNVYLNNPSLPQPPATVAQPAPQPPGPIVYPAFPAADQALFSRALLQFCDPLDGVSDGVVDNVPACNNRFDPATANYTSGGVTYPLQCTGAKNATCLSPAQIAAVKNIKQGPRSNGKAVRSPAGQEAPDHVKAIVQGYAYDGGFFATTGIPSRKIGNPTGVPGDFSLGVGSFGYGFLCPHQPTYYTFGFNFDSQSDLAMLCKTSPHVEAATSLNIDRFVKYGHKAIWYHGLSDPGPPVIETTLYYNQMADRYGGLDAAQKFSRYYPIPGMGHCSGGPATDQFDLVAPLTNWVEHGVAPGAVTGSGSNFTTARYQTDHIQSPPISAPASRSRPICPYPQQARFTGSTQVVSGLRVAVNPADLASASNYVCVKP